MTAVAAPEVMAVLRPAKLDKKDTAIVLAVAKCYADGGHPSLRDIVNGSGVKMMSLRYRMWGVHHHRFHRTGGGLIENGWLCMTAGRNRTLMPGPKFGGMQRRAGVIYERVPAG